MVEIKDFRNEVKTNGNKNIRNEMKINRRNIRNKMESNRK